MPISKTFYSYAESVSKTFADAGLYAEADLSDNTLNKKIRNAQTAQWNFIMVVGQDEESSRSVNIRNRDDAHGREETVLVDEALKLLIKLKESKAAENKLGA